MSKRADENEGRSTFNDPILYQHEDGRYGIAYGPATFAVGDPQWHRVGPVAVVEGANWRAA